MTKYATDAADALANIELAISYTPLFTTGVDPLNPRADAGNIKRKKIDVLETEYFAPSTVAADALERFPRVVQNLLRSLINVASDAAWGSAEVARGS